MIGKRVSLAITLVAASATARAEIPTRVATIVQKNCVRCHDADNTLDLRVLPDASDTRTWLKMLTQLEGSKMPPPARSGAVAARFPLDPAERRELIEGIQALIGSRGVSPLPIEHLSRAVWVGVLVEVFRPVLPRKELIALTAPFEPRFSAGEITPLVQLRVNETSDRLCRGVTQAELARAARERSLLVGLPAEKATTLARAAARRLVSPLFSAVYREPPSDRDLAEASRFLVDLVSHGSSWPTAWAALCASYLSGPRLLLSGYVVEPSP